MRTRGLGRVLMAAGVVALIIYAMLSLHGSYPLNLRVGGILFYIGVVAIPVGAILLLIGEMKPPPKRSR